MRSGAVLLFVFICMTTLYTTKADNNQCMCVCTKDGVCKDDMAHFFLQDCTDDSCGVHCTTQYPNLCAFGASTAGSMCMSMYGAKRIGSMGCPSKSGAPSFSQNTVWGASILAVIVATVFHI